ncbi:hypothetical protein SHKM778_39870 [Streptomyces sp. KM77-8]|uniref:Uncharacterized protein n=1 Tax=Streptomyces haneummycinicus TaxID=3074435 RepID=A0AAT9HJQ5_9ACTN
MELLPTAALPAPATFTLFPLMSTGRSTGSRTLFPETTPGESCVPLTAVAPRNRRPVLVDAGVARGRIEQTHHVHRVPAHVHRDVRRELDGVPGPHTGRAGREAVRTGIGVRRHRHGHRARRRGDGDHTVSGNPSHRFPAFQTWSRALARTG